MPYTRANDHNLPSNVKSMEKKERRQWIHIFNSVIATCLEKGGTNQDCETLAFKEANGVLKKERNTP